MKHYTILNKQSQNKFENLLVLSKMKKYLNTWLIFVIVLNYFFLKVF